MGKLVEIYNGKTRLGEGRVSDEASRVERSFPLPCLAMGLVFRIRIEDVGEVPPEARDALVDETLNVPDVLPILLLLGLGEAVDGRDDIVDDVGHLHDAAEIVLEAVHISNGSEIAVARDQERLGAVYVAQKLIEPRVGHLGLMVGGGQLLRDARQSLEGPAQLVLEEPHDGVIGAGTIGDELVILGAGLELGLVGASLSGDSHTGLSSSSVLSLRRAISELNAYHVKYTILY